MSRYLNRTPVVPLAPRFECISEKCHGRHLNKDMSCLDMAPPQFTEAGWARGRKMAHYFFVRPRSTRNHRSPSACGSGYSEEMVTVQDPSVLEQTICKNCTKIVNGQ